MTDCGAAPQCVHPWPDVPAYVSCHTCHRPCLVTLPCLTHHTPSTHRPWRCPPHAPTNLLDVTTCVNALDTQAVALSTPRTDEATLQLALASLQLAGAGSRADSEAAASLLTELGVFRRHEPLGLLQRGVSEDSPEEEVRVAQVGVAGRGVVRRARARVGKQINAMFYNASESKHGYSTLKLERE